MAEPFQLNLPQPKYPVIRLGKTVQKTRLDRILEAAQIDY